MADERPAFTGDAPAPSATADAAAPAEGAAAAQPKRQSMNVAKWGTKRMIYTLRAANLINGLLLVMVGILIFLSGMVSITFTTVTVAAYIVFFGIMITCLECNIGNVAPKFRRNFGFIFSFVGRTVFLLFCSTMLFALAVWLGYLIGAVTAVNGLFNGYVICVHPAFRTGELSAKGDPFGGYSGGESIMLEYLKKNPQLANKAAGAAVAFAKSHPEQALAMASAVSSANAAGAKAPSDAGGAANPWS